MANEVCTSLGLVGKDLSGKVIHIVEEHGSDVSFMVGSLMANWSSVCLLALHNTGTHYQNVAKKLGFNLKAAIDNKSAVVLEPFNMYGQVGLDMQDEDNMKRLWCDVREALQSLAGKKVLIIDDLSDLMCVGASVAIVVTFFQYCRALQDTDKDLALVVCSHCSEENQDQKMLSNFIAHLADLRATVAGLKTGFSTNVTGSIEVVEGENVGPKLYHFRLTDRQVKVFAPGFVGIQT